MKIIYIYIYIWWTAIISRNTTNNGDGAWTRIFQPLEPKPEFISRIPKPKFIPRIPKLKDSLQMPQLNVDFKLRHRQEKMFLRVDFSTTGVGFFWFWLGGDLCAMSKLREDPTVDVNVTILIRLRHSIFVLIVRSYPYKIHLYVSTCILYVFTSDSDYAYQLFIFLKHLFQSTVTWVRFLDYVFKYLFFFHKAKQHASWSFAIIFNLQGLRENLDSKKTNLFKTNKV